MAKKTPKDELRKQYEREYKRIIQAIYRQTKIGYNISEQIKPIKPSKIKTITQQDVDRLVQITPKKIRKSSIYIDKETGESFDGLDVVNSHNKAKKPKAKGRRKSYNPKLSDSNPDISAPPKENNLNLQIIDQVTELLVEWMPEPDWPDSFRIKKEINRNQLLIEWNDLLLSEGEYEVAYRIENRADALIETIDKLIHVSSSPDEETADFAFVHEIIFGRALTAEESDWYNSEAVASVMDSLRGGNSFA